MQMVINSLCRTVPVPSGEAEQSVRGIRRGQRVDRSRYRTDCRLPVPELQVVNRAPRHNADKLRVLAFNAKGGRRLNVLLECLRRPPLAEANVILLCDVDCRNILSGYLEIASEIASALRMSFAYVPKLHNDCIFPTSCIVSGVMQF
jgi:hypothetical protein